MRLLLAMMKHETNTFSPVRTDLARFSLDGAGAPESGAAAVKAYRGTGTVTGAYIEIAEREGADFDLVLAANAWPSGPVEDEAYESMCTTIIGAATGSRRASSSCPFAMRNRTRLMRYCATVGRRWTDSRNMGSASRGRSSRHCRPRSRGRTWPGSRR